jgi:hypothetical protein
MEEEAVSIIWVSLLAAILLTIVLGGILIVLLAMWRGTKIREMQHRERLAMIERGLMPPPERDPAAYEPARRSEVRESFTSIGIALVALGLGLMLIIGFAGGAPGPAVGVGGAIAVLGAAFIVNGLLQRSRPAARGRTEPPEDRSTAL